MGRLSDIDYEIRDCHLRIVELRVQRVDIAGETFFKCKSCGKSLTEWSECIS